MAKKKISTSVENGRNRAQEHPSTNIRTTMSTDQILKLQQIERKISQKNIKQELENNVINYTQQNQLRKLANEVVWTTPRRPPKKYEDQLKLNDRFKVDINQRNCDKRSHSRSILQTNSSSQMNKILKENKKTSEQSSKYQQMRIMEQLSEQSINNINSEIQSPGQLNSYEYSEYGGLNINPNHNGTNGTKLIRMNSRELRTPT